MPRGKGLEIYLPIETISAQKISVDQDLQD